MAPQLVRLQDPASGASAKVLVGYGFNCFSWKAPFGPGEPPRELLWAEEGFASGDKRPSHSGTPLLFPFPGRLRGGSFEYAGRRYQLRVEGERENAIHGYALDAPWRVTNQTGDAVTAEFRPSLDATDALPLWTGDYRLEATYRVAGGRLEFEVVVENVGEAPLPWGFGTHAYFRLPLADVSDPEQTVLRASIDALWSTDDLVPNGRVLPLGEHAGLAVGDLLAGKEYDTTFRMAEVDAPVTELHDPTSGRVVRQTCDAAMRTCVIYTPGHREAVCLEPYTCVPNAFELEAMGVATGQRVLTPGERDQTRVLMEALVE